MGLPYENNGFTNGKTAPYYLAEKLNIDLQIGADVKYSLLEYYKPGTNYALAGTKIKKEKNIFKKLVTDNFRLPLQAEALIKNHENLNKNDLFFINYWQ